MSEANHPVCRFCGSTNISIDALAIWHPEAREWVLSGTQDNINCASCGDDQYDPAIVSYDEYRIRGFVEGGLTRADAEAKHAADKTKADGN
jgi:hypothetical protein